MPSQIRYVNYFEKALTWGWTATTIPTVTVTIKTIKIYTIPKIALMGGCSIDFSALPYVQGPYFKLSNESQELNSKHQFKIKSYKSQAYIEWEGIKNATVSGDILLQIFHKKLLGGKVRLCFCPNDRKKYFNCGLTQLFSRQAEYLSSRKLC